MAATSTTETWDAAWTLTMRSKRKELTDNFFDAYPTLDMFRSGGALVTDNGGKEIQVDLMYGGNTAQYFSGYDVLTMGLQRQYHVEECPLFWKTEQL
jgi:hypothetical protein